MIKATMVPFIPRHMLGYAPFGYRMPRKKPPSRRRNHTTEVIIGDPESGGSHLVFTISEYDDGMPCEVFLDTRTPTPEYVGLLDSFAILLSHALQWGVPLDHLVDKFTYTRFSPAGIVRGHDRISICTSVPDLVFRHMGIRYLDMDHLAHKTKETGHGSADIQ